MNGYERISAVLDGKQPDRTPMMLHCFMTAAGEVGYSMGQYRSDAHKVAQTHLAFAEKYHMDGILMDIDTCMEADAIGVPVDFPDHEPARVTGPLSTDKKALLAAMQPEKLLQNRRIDTALESVRLMKERAAGQLLIRGNCDQMAFSLAMLAYGMTDFMADLLDEDREDDILELIDAAYNVHLAYHKLMHEAGADLTSFGDSSCGPDLLSRDCYLKYSHPFHVRLQRDLAALKIRTVCHICGNLDRILPDVADVGYPAIEADYKTDAVRAQRILAGKNTFFGPIDPSGVFYFGTPEQVVAETHRILTIFGGKGLVIGAGCALPTGTPEANLRAFSDTVRSFPLVYSNTTKE